MRVTINLATQPYQDVRSFALRWSVGLLLLAVIAAGLVYKAIEGWRSTRDIGAKISADQEQMSKLNEDISKGNVELNRPANRDIRMQSAFLNTLIARKAFSWTEAFSTLEKIMPPRLHVVSMQPELDEQNRLTLKMRVAGDSRDSFLTLLRRMENTPEFLSPQPESEAPGKNGQEEFQLSTLYVPTWPTSPENEQPAPQKPARPARATSAAAPRSGAQ
jgi:type IV pilus assembly protein PilN